MARRRRVLGLGESYYHITTRIVDKIYRFTPEENEMNVVLLRDVEEFSCVQILSYCFMSNHLHILLRVPIRKELTEEELLDRIQALYGYTYRKNLKWRWDWAKEHDREWEVDAEKASFTRRMFDMGEFMKTLKQRLTISYNMRHGRAGTLWESRYKSILLEGTAKVLSAVAAYIDLNPVRGGMVSDPTKYVFSSYGEACRGNGKARAGICRLYQEGNDVTPSWEDVVAVYRMRLTTKAMSEKKAASMKFEDALNAVEETGGFRLDEILSHKCTFLTTGWAFGSAAYLRQLRKDLRDRTRRSFSVPLTP